MVVRLPVLAAALDAEACRSQSTTASHQKPAVPNILRHLSLAAGKLRPCSTSRVASTPRRPCAPLIARRASVSTGSYNNAAPPTLVIITCRMRPDALTVTLMVASFRRPTCFNLPRVRAHQRIQLVTDPIVVASTVQAVSSIL
ncbi:hypothetical protein OH76DRAFT_758584 [Lentinus brumalis]|uniref:Uncharacterized protein n=1 Tax=Lentinus brumalis TaxID=2498619 RepID=A0A371DT14_9APHY|nr:hypothetical protein OH76DRAFT_758584 [Polyporus brumalis]